MTETVGMAAAAVEGQAVVFVCACMAVFYVAILYAPTLLLRLPQPESLNNYMLRRFVCAMISSVVSILASSALLGIRSFRDFSFVLRIFGIRADHMWQAVTFPILLTCLPYAGSLASKFVLFVHEWRETSCDGGFHMFCCRRLINRISLESTNVLAWRNYLVAPLTEELVFRACMIPLLLCGGFRTYTVVFLCPIFFSLAHLNNFLELYFVKKYSILKASMALGVQLGYTVIFGWYAAFLFTRTGNLLSPFVAHIICNLMGLPDWRSLHSKVVAGVILLGGFLGFFLLLFPATDPKIYTNSSNDCSCWHGYCNWN